ncbi:hypothetical protein [Pseudoalteromonas denitrificans]|uniref:Uncharacterized protein n=1 Tax=Pseudoalteromonas denitrificans DSM 6059 TaxID=1123010 RepID=A0A1I1EYV3_9GAMM|nr:hypothetical protein [Pseudoalteromonas denitrificans]SFB90110.1 hypothetical protein SAMN02745724_00423 [Pseudoalteromonas denitrificans DSM 6059]
MKLYPYSKIQTENLKPLLFISRLLGAGSYILIVAALAMFPAWIYMDFIAIDPGNSKLQGILIIAATLFSMAILVSLVSSLFVAFIKWENTKPT